jgi:hypothetical protein
MFWMIAAIRVFPCLLKLVIGCAMGWAHSHPAGGYPHGTLIAILEEPRRREKRFCVRTANKKTGKLVCVTQ